MIIGQRLQKLPHTKYTVCICIQRFEEISHADTVDSLRGTEMGLFGLKAFLLHICNT
jgi:hypothetical protein